MIAAGARRLDAGDPLPALSMSTVAHGTITVPDWFGVAWGVLLLYRAGW